MFMARHLLRGDRRCAVGVMFAVMVIPIIGAAGLAFDYGVLDETQATMAVAVNVAVQNAVKTAAAADLKNDPAYLAEGTTAGRQWFSVAIGQGNRAAVLPQSLTPTVSLSVSGKTINGTVSYTGKMNSIFGNIFGTGQYPVSVSASASIDTAPYLNVDVLLDNSNSMQIAASPLDVAAMLLITPCSAAGSTVTYDGYVFSGGTGTYTPPAVTGWPDIKLPKTDGSTLDLQQTRNPVGPSCAGVKGAAPGVLTAGSPCAFACHYDQTKPAGTGNDAFGLARSTIGGGRTPCSQTTTLAQLSNCSIQLRFDVVKGAVQNLISTMAADNTAGNNLQVGIWDFNTSLNRDYPSTGEAGSDFAAAAAAVGSAPSVANGAETGIQPDTLVGQASHDDTDFNGAASTLAATLTPAGNGQTQATARKVLFVVSDGMQDRPSPSAINASNCTTFKNMGYTVYVIYTPYYLNPHIATLNNASLVQSSNGTPPVPAALQACASATADYIQATDTAGLTAALNTFLKSALNSPVTYTQ